MRRRKLLSLFLSLCLCLSLLPTAALAEDVQTEPLTEAAVTFPAPQAGETIGTGLDAVAADEDSGLTPYQFLPVLWQQPGQGQELTSEDVYKAGNTYLLQLFFYTAKPITEETSVTFNGKPVKIFTSSTALVEETDKYDGTQDAYFAYLFFSEDGIGDSSEAVKNVYILWLYACVHIPKVLTTVEVSTAAELTTALSGTDDIVKLTNDITIEARLDIARDVTVDLNGHVLRYAETANPDSIFRVAGARP